MRIGRIVKVLTDPNRYEIFSSNKEKRRLIISAFYPVDNEWSTNRQALYKDLYYPHEEKFVEGWKDSEAHGDYINKLTTNIYTNAPMINNNEKYPVILYSPGFTCDRDLTVFMIEKLVEEGYIVITLGSIHETEFTIMPNGEVIEMSKDLEDMSSDSKLWKELIDIRKKDILFVLNQLDHMNKNDEFLKGKLDVEKVGVIGFSLGSQASFEVAAEDKRIKAVVLLEGCMHNTTVIERVKLGERTNTPHLLIKRHASSHALRVEECKNWYVNMEDRIEAEKLLEEQVEIATRITKTQKALYEYVDGFKSFIKINHTKHMTFCDMPILLNQEQEECLGGKISTRKAHDIINKVTIKFLNEFIKGSTNEYQEFINSKNTYSELKQIDGEGEIIK